MTVDEINRELQALARLPAGRAKAQRLETLAEQAKQVGDRAMETRVLLALSGAYEYAAEREKLPMALGRLLKLADQYPAEVGHQRRTIYWQLKWMTTSMILNPAVPLETVYRWMDELESRYRQEGYSLRPVFAARSELAQFLGDTAQASTALEASIAAERDHMCDCHACERNQWGGWREWLGDDEGALEHWGPVLDGKHRCNEEPHRVLACVLLPLVRLGRLDEARGAFLRGYPMVKGNLSLMTAVGRHVEFCALTGNEARGLEILAEHASWLNDTQVDAIRRLNFLQGVTVLLRRLRYLGHGGLPVGASATVAELLASYEAELRELCLRYDKRHDSSAVSEQTAARLERQPLVDHLPLGLPSRLPAAAVAPPPVTGPGGSPADLIARARELDAANHPDAGRAWARVGACGADLPPDVALLVAEARAAGAMREDPAAARTALLAVADSFDAAGDAAGALRARSAAARALSAAGDHDTARAEAAALAASARAAGSLTPRQRLALLGSEHMVAVFALGAAQTRSPADIDAVAAAVSGTLADAEQCAEPHSAGRCHELLAQLDLWRESQEGAREHFRAAREYYVAAGEPWFAAGPAEALGQFALRDGDAAAAESCARFAQASARQLEPQQRAMLASLLVESLLAQPDRQADVASAALAAAARWDGISEPDTLHNTFHAARAYASLGRHDEAAALFAQAIPRVSVPYDQTGIAMTHEAYGRSLRETGQHAEAATQFLAAARLIADAPGNAGAHASLASAAAESLQRAGQAEAALAAFQRAADLHRKRGDLVNQVRAQRSAALVEFRLRPAAAEGQEHPAVAAMGSVLAELESAVTGDGPPELAAEVENTRRQLAALQQALAKASAAAQSGSEGDDER